MTRAEGMEQMDRFAAAGYPSPPDDKIGAMFDEWFAACQHYPCATVAAAVTHLIRTRTSPYWPTVAEMRQALGAIVAASPRQRAACAQCQGTTWVEAQPYRANGGHVYQGVMRCPACGVPAPSADWLREAQTPFSPGELREWLRAQDARPVNAQIRAVVDRALARLRGEAA